MKVGDREFESLARHGGKPATVGNSDITGHALPVCEQQENFTQ